MPIGTPVYPVNLVVAGRPVLLVGGGGVARRKAEALAVCGAQITVVAPRILSAIEQLAGVRCERRPYATGDIAGHQLVVCAVDDRRVAEQVAADAEEAGVWVNVADDPDLCSVALPAVVRRGPITVAVGTGGRSPALASWLRRWLEQEIGPEYETVLELMDHARRAVHESGRSTEGLDWHAALDGGMLDLVRSGRIEEARSRLEAVLTREESPTCR